MRRIVLTFLLFSSSFFFAQVKTDSIRKADSILKVDLSNRINSLQKKLDSIVSREPKKEKKKDSIKPWSVEGRFTFIFNQSSFTNWASGGDNTVAGNVVINYDFDYVKGNWKWDNKIITSYGASHVGGGKGYRKTDDRFEYNSVLAYNTSKNWYFSFFNNFISQYSNGFDYSKDPPLPISSIFSPAYLSFGPGVLWRKSERYRINIAPATARLTFVSKEFSGKFGTDPGKTSNFGLGFNLSAYLKYQLMKDLTMENIIALYADYLDKPKNVDVNYQTNFYVSVNKYLSMNVTFHVISDSNASSKVQFRQLFGVGVNYTFHKI